AVVSEEGKGTTFTVRLPYKKAEELPQSPQPQSTELMVAADNGGVTNQEWLSNLYRRAEFFPAINPAQQEHETQERSRNGILPTLLVADDEPDMLRFLK